MAPAWSASILGLAAAVPPDAVSQDEIFRRWLPARGGGKADNEAAAAAFAATGAERRSLATPLDVLLGSPPASDGPALLEALDASLRDLARRAAERALAAWGQQRGRLTHLLYGCSSRKDSPSLEVQLIQELDLPLTLQRVSTDHSGPLSSARLIAAAAAICQQDPAARVLVVDADVLWGACLMRLVDGLENRRGALLAGGREEELPADELRDFLALALAAGDGAGAAVVGLSPVGGERELLRVCAVESVSCPISLSAPAACEESEPGTLEPEADAAPTFGGRGAFHVRTLVARALAIAGCAPQSVGGLAHLLIHPESAAVLDAVGSALDATPGQLRLSRELLRSSGAPQGFSALALLDAYAREPLSPGPAGEWALSLSFTLDAGAVAIVVLRPSPPGEACTPAPAADPGDRELLLQWADKDHAASFLKAALADDLLMDGGWDASADDTPLAGLGGDSFLVTVVFRRLPRSIQARARVQSSALRER